MRVILWRLLPNAFELAAANAHDRRADFIVKLWITFHLQRAAPINDARAQSAPWCVASIAPGDLGGKSQMAVDELVRASWSRRAPAFGQHVLFLLVRLHHREPPDFPQITGAGFGRHVSSAAASRPMTFGKLPVSKQIIGT
jgi:hypothetical protein